jgi:predicted O-linked N-acetylglucosamine transferase (SPINDLY family)
MVPSAMSNRLEDAVTLHRAGRLAEAEPIYEEILRADPNCADAWQFLGLIALSREDSAGAIERIERAIALNPNVGVYYFNLGLALKRRGDVAAAIASYRQALVLTPGLVEAQSNLGNALRDIGDLEGAVEACRQAIALRPTYAEAHVNLGGALQDLRRLDEAVALYRGAIALAPKLAPAHYNLGLAFYEQGKLDAAVISLRDALALNPHYAEAWNNLAVALLAHGEFAQAAEAYRKVVALGTDASAIAYRNLLGVMLYDPALTEAARWSTAREFEARYAEGANARPAPVFANMRDGERRLRIGYVSSDFHGHPVGRNVEPVLAHRDRTRFETFIYAEVARPDAVTARFQELADGWRSTVGLSDEQVAAQVRADQVDVLVLLAGRFDRNRPLVAAYRSAPVQVSFHDPGTSGLSAMDYLIADRVLVPRRPVERFTERVIRLPSFYIHAPIAQAPEVTALPAAHRGYVTFGSFNNPAKVNDRVLALWGEVLRAVPNSRLKLKCKNWFDNASLRQRVLERLGDVAGRVEFDLTDRSIADHLALYADIDIALDPFPFTGSTTTFEALWMGVPVVTLLGEAMVGRWSASILHPLKLDELIARDATEYVRIALQLAGDTARLGALRSGLRARVAGSPLTDGRVRARQMERIYRALWRRWCRRP